MAAGHKILIMLILGIQMLLLPFTICAPAKGQLHWKKDDFFDNFITGFYDYSLVLDCELNSPSVNVTFLIMQFDSSFTRIVIDGTKYQRIGSQKVRINNLSADDAVPHVCRAEGVRDKTINVYIERKMERIDFSVSISGEREQKEKCSRKTADERQIICKATGHGKLGLYRLKNRTGELITRVRNESGFEGGHMVQKVFYKIEDATKKDEGDYICYFDTGGHGRLSSKKFHLLVDDSPPVIRSFSPRVAEEGDRVTLKCKPSMIWPPEEITYYVNGRPITDPRFNSRYKANCQKLRIDKVKYPDDNAVFTCKVHNKYGVDVKNATLRVLVKPEIDKSLSAIVEQDVPITCKIRRSNPPANIKWQVQPYCHNRIRECWYKERLWKDAESSQFRIFSSKSYSKVYVPPQARGDYFFRCVANNSAGADRHVFKFLYIREVGSPLEIVNKSMKVNEKETILITCKSRPRLFSKLSWLKDGKNVSEGVVGISDPQLSHVTRSVLKIDSATLNDTGNYTCIGHGWRGGVVLTNATIIVKKIFPPTVDLRGQSNVHEGNAVILHCNVKSNPASQIVWYKDGTEIKVEDRNFFRGADQCQSSKNGYYFKLENGEKKFSHLIICDSTLDKNNGTYMCKAQNQLGSGNSSTILNVLKRPFLELKAAVSVEVGDSVNEICKAIGNPKPKVYWRQKASGERMSSESHSSSRLVITKVSEKDFTLYECFAWNAVGNASATMEIQPVNHPVLARTLSARTDQTNSTRLYILLAVSFLGIIIVLSAVFVLLRRRKIYGGFYLFSQPPDPDYFRDIDPSRALIEQTNGLPYDPVWEFPRKRIRLLDRLGSGAFGDVHLAEAVGIVGFDPREKTCMKHKPLVGRRRSRSGSTSSRTGSSYRRLVTKVAVKKLKENATPEEMRDLVSELKILIHIGEHSNIVNLLGACTRGGDKELMVILEYAPHGNLLSFLKSRRQMLKTTWKKEAIGMEDELTTCDLAVIAYQVAKGMEFLASRRCVHRDLAARNVLVGEGHIMKIADFGLARDIYKDDRYVKLSAGLLPIKWMAIEAIKERIFTHQSDVWSYGILLWEIMTMGGSPYPGLPVRDLLEALVSGYRMDKPIYCPDEIYYLMGDCWIEDPNDRPSFVEIVNKCARIIEARLTPEESCNFLDPEHFTGDGYLRPIESPRSPITSLISPPPPYSAYINQKENRFFGSDVSLEEENSCKKVDYPDVVSLETKRLNSVSEMKAKRDAAQKEKKDSLSSSLPENEFEGESDSTEATAPSPLLNGRVGYTNGSDTVNFYDCDKDVDEIEQRCMLLDEHSYINHTGHNFENQYLNA